MSPAVSIKTSHFRAARTAHAADVKDVPDRIQLFAERRADVRACALAEDAFRGLFGNGQALTGVDVGHLTTGAIEGPPSDASTFLGDHLRYVDGEEVQDASFALPRQRELRRSDFTQDRGLNAGLLSSLPEGGLLRRLALLDVVLGKHPLGLA